MKIVIIGSSSTGKTTLCKELVNIGIITKIISVDAISILKKNNLTNIDNLTKSEFLCFQEEIFECRERIESIENDFISDRSFIDGFAYLMAKKLPYLKYLKKYHNNIKDYDYIFYLPINLIPYENNLYRSKNEKFNILVDENIKAILKKLKLKYHIIDTSILNERVNFINEVINKNV